MFNVVHGKLVSQTEYGMWVYGKKFGLYRVCVSFTLCWLSLLPGFKGFIGKVVYPPFLLSLGRTSLDSTWDLS